MASYMNLVVFLALAFTIVSIGQIQALTYSPKGNVISGAALNERNWDKSLAPYNVITVNIGDTVRFVFDGSTTFREVTLDKFLRCDEKGSISGAIDSTSTFVAGPFNTLGSRYFLSKGSPSGDCDPDGMKVQIDTEVATKSPTTKAPVTSNPTVAITKAPVTSNPTVVAITKAPVTSSPTLASDIQDGAKGDEEEVAASANEIIIAGVLGVLAVSLAGLVFYKSRRYFQKRRLDEEALGMNGLVSPVSSSKLRFGGPPSHHRRTNSVNLGVPVSSRPTQKASSEIKMASLFQNLKPIQEYKELSLAEKIKKKISSLFYSGASTQTDPESGINSIPQRLHRFFESNDPDRLEELEQFLVEWSDALKTSDGVARLNTILYSAFGKDLNDYYVKIDEDGNILPEAQNGGNLAHFSVAPWLRMPSIVHGRQVPKHSIQFGA